MRFARKSNFPGLAGFGLSNEPFIELEGEDIGDGKVGFAVISGLTFAKLAGFTAESGGGDLDMDVAAGGEAAFSRPCKIGFDSGATGLRSSFVGELALWSFALLISAIQEGCAGAS